MAHYVNRKDGGTYIAGTNDKGARNPLGEIGIRPISYSKEVAEFAAENRVSYRKAFIVATHKEDLVALGIDIKDYLK